MTEQMEAWPTMDAQPIWSATAQIYEPKSGVRDWPNPDGFLGPPASCRPLPCAGRMPAVPGGRSAILLSGFLNRERSGRHSFFTRYAQ